MNTIRIRLSHEWLGVKLAYLTGKDAESEKGKEHANSSSLALYIVSCSCQVQTKAFLICPCTLRAVQSTSAYTRSTWMQLSFTLRRYR